MSHESLPQDTQHIYAELYRASQAMVSLIVLREAHDLQPNDIDSDTNESWIRSEISRLQQEALDLDPTGEHRPERSVSLAESLMNQHLSDFAVPGRPITQERIREVDPSLLDVVATMETEGIGWPVDDYVFHDVLPEDFNDKMFGEKLVHANAAYNNFPAFLRSLPSRPLEGEGIMTYMQRNPDFAYESKPYVARAYALQPDFMKALQTRMVEVGSPQEWRERLFSAVSEDYPDPEDQILLRASRLAYQLFINLMRKDDLLIQSQILMMSSQQDITDPIKELWT